MNDVTVLEGVQIEIKADGKVIWVNIDGVCRLRIINSENKEIQIIDNRSSHEENTNQLNIQWEKQNPERKENGTS